MAAIHLGVWQYVLVVFGSVRYPYGGMTLASLPVFVAKAISWLGLHFQYFNSIPKVKP